jgi:hypothetical protein
MVYSMLIYTKKVTILIAIVVVCTLGSLPASASALPIRVSPLKSVSLAPSVNCKGMSIRACENASSAEANAAAQARANAAAARSRANAAAARSRANAAAAQARANAAAAQARANAAAEARQAAAARSRANAAAAQARANAAAKPASTVKPPAPVAPVKPSASTVKLPSPVIPVKNLVATNNDPSTKCGTAIYLCTSRPNFAETPGVTTNFSVVDNFASNSSTVCTKSQQNASNTKCSAGAATQNIMKNFDNAATTAATLVKSGTDQVTIVFTGFNTVANSSPSTDNEKNSAMRAAQSASDFCGSTSTVRYANNGQVNGAASTDKCVIYYANQNNPTFATAKTACELAAQKAQKICVLSTPQKVTNNNYNMQGLRVTSATITTKPTSSICCDSTTTPVPGGSTTTGSGGSTTTGPGGTPTPGPGGSTTPGPGGSYTDIPGTAPDYSEYPEAIDPDTDEPWVISLVVNVKVPANYVANGKKTTLTATVTLLCGDSPCGSKSLADSFDETVTMFQKVETGLCSRPTQLNCLYYAPENGKEQAAPATYTMHFYTPSLSSKQITTVVKVDATVTRWIPLEDGDFIEVNVNDYNTIYQVNGLKVPSNEISRPVLGSRG